MTHRTATAVLLCVFALPTFAQTTRPVVPLTNVHAHNDYMHEHPLFDALACGICSVEADIHLVNGELLVAHELYAVKPGRTLQSLYLEPLRQRIKQNGGRVFPNGPVVVLLIDVKTPFDETYPMLRKVLGDYRDVLTTWTDGHRQDGALMAIITGNRKQAVIAAENPRLCAFDGEMSDLDTNPPAELVPWISHQWTRTFKWKAKGEAPMPEAERQKLREIVAKAHQQGRKVRFWGGPDNLAAWTEERADGVDILNTDHLRECADFLLGQGK